MSRTTRFAAALVAAALLASCDSGSSGGANASPGGAFPFDGTSGKEDTFGRSLVGVPDPYHPSSELLSDPASAEAELKSNIRRRREVAWQTARKLLEPVPLLGLQDQIDALPDCPDRVATRDVDKCGSQRDEASCTAFSSGGISGICAWDASASSCAPTCDNLTLPDGQQIPRIPRFSTWYGVEDVNRIFKYAYAHLSDDEQLARAPFSDLLIGQAFEDNNTAVERSSRWPLRRYTKAVLDLFGCDLTQQPDESDDDFAARCAESRQSQFSGSSTAGGGIARMIYSPAMVLHLMRNYAEVLNCRDDQLQDTWCGGDTPCADPPDNFSSCFKTEFPADAGNPWADLDPAEAGPVAGLREVGGTVLVKATWARVGFGFDLPAFDTDAQAMANRMGPGEKALWGDDGDRQYASPKSPDDPAFPTPDDIYTIKTHAGSVYRLTALHIMTKELRHWQWVTLWWSDKPDSDFGADRPASFAELPEVWSHYKMCVVDDYTESDPDPAARFDDIPTLQAALTAVGAEQGKPTWCSNPYIEHGAGNARTNCIGCHQHAGTRFKEAPTGTEPSAFDLDEIIAHESPDLSATNRYPANGRIRRRLRFASDYSWAFSRLDDLTELIRKEVEYDGSQDARWVRMNKILTGDGDVTRGEEVFRNASPTQTCTDCHGMNGEGGIGPNYEQVFAQKTDWQLLNTILTGKPPMPAWGDRLTDQQLTDLFAFLKANFDHE